MSVSTLRDLIDTSLDGEWGKGEPASDHVPMLCIRGTDFASARIGCLEGVPLRYVQARKADRKVLRPFDIVMEVAGGTKNEITGRTLLVRPPLFQQSEHALTCASFSRFIRIRRELCDPEYLFWFLQYLYASGKMHAYHTQHTGVARFQWTTFADREPVDLPSFAEQRRIAGILSAYDALIENCERRIRVLDEMARSLYREWFVDRSPVPTQRTTVPLREVADVNAAKVDARNPPATIGYIDIASVSPGRIDAINPLVFDDAPGRARRVVRHGDTLWSCVRPNRRSHALVMQPDANTIASTGFVVLTPRRVPAS